MNVECALYLHRHRLSIYTKKYGAKFDEKNSFKIISCQIVCKVHFKSKFHFIETHLEKNNGNSVQYLMEESLGDDVI